MNAIVDKSFKLGVEIIQLVERNRNISPVLLNQLLRSGTSVGANVMEGQAAITKKEFIAKLSIAAKEVRETKYWLMLLKETGKIGNEESIFELVDENIRLLTSIIKSSQKSEQRN